MKALFSTALLWAGLFMPLLNAQTARNTDTLKIYDQDRLMMSVASPKIQELKKGMRMVNLLEAFRNNFTSIQTQIPEYTISEIFYEKNASLRIEEVEGVVRYQVNDGITSTEFNQNVAYLQDQDLIITIYFNELSELSDKKYDKMLDQAFAEVPQPPSKFKEIFSSINVYNYSLSQGAMMNKNSEAYKKYALAVPLTLSGGVFQNQLIYEFGVGLGMYVGSKNRSFIYSFYNDTYTYDSELERGKTQAIWGIAFSTPNIGMSFGIPLNESEDNLIYKDIIFRYGISSKAVRNVSVNAFVYFEEKFREAHLGMSIGVGF